MKKSLTAYEVEVENMKAKEKEMKAQQKEHEEKIQLAEEMYTAYIFKTTLQATGSRLNYVLHVEDSKGKVIAQKQASNAADLKDLLNRYKKTWQSQGHKAKLIESVNDIFKKKHEEALNEAWIHDQIKKAMKKIWAYLQPMNPDIPMTSLPAFIANLDMMTIQKVIKDSELLTYFDNLSVSTKLSLAKEAFR
jgi:DNA-binding protein H-NS